MPHTFLSTICKEVSPLWVGEAEASLECRHRLRSTAPADQESENLLSASGGFFVALVRGISVCEN